MTDATVAAPRRSRRAFAVKIAGIVGIVACAALIVALWIGRGAVASSLDGLASDVSGGFDRAIAATDAVATRLGDAASSMKSIDADATELASTASPSPDRFAGIQARLAAVGDQYRQLRLRYADIRENVVALSSRVQQVARLIPGQRIPEGAGDRLRAVDEKLTAIDDALTSTFGSIGQGEVSSAAAQKLADGAAKVDAAITAGAAAVQGISTRLDTAQSNADDAVDGIQTLLLIAAVAISILLLWVLLLNVALWLLGRAWQREEDAAVAAGAGNEPAGPAAVG
jgi:methyl-accepting chemotaxis protein